MTPPRLEIIGVVGIAEVRPGDDVTQLILDAARAQGTPLATHDVLVIGQKIVSKAEGRIVRLADVEPAEATRRMAEALGRDPRLLELVLR
jgi:coenzyme F420-0:L-glutamate ligase/coenzyme F420-1:gamma-L-glutamate ligase